MVPAKSQTQMARESKETRGKVICTRLFLKTDSAPSPRTCPKEASGNSTEPASLGVKQSAADAGICRDRTAIQTAGAVSGGRAVTRGGSSVAHAPPPGPHPLPWPPPPHLAGRPRLFPFRGRWRAECVTSRKDELARGEPASGSGWQRPFGSGHASGGATFWVGCGRQKSRFSGRGARTPPRHTWRS